MNRLFFISPRMFFVLLFALISVHAAGISTSRSNLRTKSGMVADSSSTVSNDGMQQAEVTALRDAATGQASGRVMPTVNKKTDATAAGVDCKVTDPTECPAGTTLINCDCMASSTDTKATGTGTERLLPTVNKKIVKAAESSGGEEDTTMQAKPGSDPFKGTNVGKIKQKAQSGNK